MSVVQNNASNPLNGFSSVYLHLYSGYHEKSHHTGPVYY